MGRSLIIWRALRLIFLGQHTHRRRNLRVSRKVWVRLVKDPLVFLLGEGTGTVVAQFRQQYLRQRLRLLALFFLRRRSREEIALLGDVRGRKLQAIEEQPGGPVIDCVGDDAAHDLINADLDGRRVFGEGDAQSSIAGKAIGFLNEIVKAAVFFMAQRRLATLFVVELEVQALRRAEVFFSVFHRDDFPKRLLIDNLTPTPLLVANAGAYEVVRLYIRHNKGVKASLRQNKGLSGNGLRGPLPSCQLIVVSCQKRFSIS
jgi:hypothetical protein